MTKEKIDTAKNARFMDVVQWLIDNGKAENQGDLTVKAGFGPNIISRINHNHNTVSEETIRTLGEKFKEINIEYIRGKSDSISLNKNPKIEKPDTLMDEYIATLKSQMADLRIQLVDKQNIIDAKQQTIDILMRENAELRSTVARLQQEKSIGDFPFKMGVSDRDDKPHTRV